ncbi:MAG: SOS response-associated peptidase family protein [Pseudomonadota bacterium]
MCNLFSNTMPADAMRSLFEVAPDQDHLGNAPPLSAIFPDADVPIVRVGEGGRQLVRARWGWSKAPFGWVTNARKLDGFPWKFAIGRKDQRCLVPATSFAEYHPSQQIAGKSGKPIKAATWFRLIGQGYRPPFAFAGFARDWNWEKQGLRRKSDQPLKDTGTPVRAMAFLTTRPNCIVAPIHPKAMPVILRSTEEFECWLTGSAEEAAALQRPLPDESLEIAFTGAKEDPQPTLGH